MKTLIIDGYNLMHALDSARDRLRTSGAFSLEEQRNALIVRLARYRRAAGPVRVILVFDAWQFGLSVPTREPQDGVDVRFSARGQKADDLIIELARDFRQGATVVSSDRFVRQSVEADRGVVISSEVFAVRLCQSISAAKSSHRECLDPTESTERQKVRSTKKRGNPRRASKKDRRQRRVIKSL